jgi:hypothetical protein
MQEEGDLNDKFMESMRRASIVTTESSLTNENLLICSKSKKYDRRTVPYLVHKYSKFKNLGSPSTNTTNFETDKSNYNLQFQTEIVSLDNPEEAEKYGRTYWVPFQLSYSKVNEDRFMNIRGDTLVPIKEQLQSADGNEQNYNNENADCSRNRNKDQMTNIIKPIRKVFKSNVYLTKKHLKSPDRNSKESWSLRKRNANRMPVSSIDFNKNNNDIISVLD